MKKIRAFIIYLTIYLLAISVGYNIYLINTVEALEQNLQFLIEREVKNASN